jgi:hypothetical protein
MTITRRKKMRKNRSRQVQYPQELAYAVSAQQKDTQEIQNPFSFNLYRSNTIFTK